MVKLQAQQVFDSIVIGPQSSRRMVVLMDDVSSLLTKYIRRGSPIIVQCHTCKVQQSCL
jgi:hypothetical protein